MRDADIGTGNRGHTRRQHVTRAARLASTMLVAACGPLARGGDQRTAESATITFMNRGGREAFAVHDKVVAAFMQKKPNIKVTVEPAIDQGYNVKLTAQLAGGTAPDTVMMAFGSFLAFCKRGDILELDKFLAKDREVRPSDWFPLALDSMRYKGKIFNMPYNGGTYAVFYNKEIFDQQRTKYPDGTWTWDKYIELATQLTTDANGKRANEAGFDGNSIARYGAESLQGLWWYWVWVNGTDLYTTNNKEVNFRDPKVLDAIQWIADMHRRRIWSSVLVKDPQPMGFRQGNVGLSPMGHWVVARVRADPFKWDVAPMPKTKDGKRIALGWYSGNGVVRTTKYPEASWDFLKFFGGAEGQRLLGIEGLTLPAVRKVAESDEIMKSTPPDNQRAFLTEIDKARIHMGWNITETRDWNEILNPELNKVWKGEAKAKDVLPSLVPRLNEVLSRN